MLVHSLCGKHLGNLAAKSDVLTGEVFQELLRRLAAKNNSGGDAHRLVDRDAGDYDAVRLNQL